MRTRRIKLTGRTSVAHLISRVVGSERLLDNIGKEVLTRMLGKQAAFCGVEVITYCVMSNHFHILLRMPEPAALTDVQLIERLEGL